ncbi:MAG: hypothetical protein ACP5UI_04105 [Thermoprotei archaeon]|nr:hypothetical protein [TACK group archaeon]
MGYKPVIVTYLGDRVEDWGHYEDYVTIKLKDSPLDSLLFNTVPVELTLGDVNWVLIGIKKGYQGDVSVELVWKGLLKRKPEFTGKGAEILNADQTLRELVSMLEPVTLEAYPVKTEESSDLNVKASFFYLPSPQAKTFVKGYVKVVERVCELIYPRQA